MVSVKALFYVNGMSESRAAAAEIEQFVPEQTAVTKSKKRKRLYAMATLASMMFTSMYIFITLMFANQVTGSSPADWKNLTFPLSNGTYVKVLQNHGKTENATVFDELHHHLLTLYADDIPRAGGFLQVCIDGLLLPEDVPASSIDRCSYSCVVWPLIVCLNGDYKIEYGIFANHNRKIDAFGVQTLVTVLNSVQ